MSTMEEIYQVHLEESKHRLRPHLVRPAADSSILRKDKDGRLTVTLAELLTPETVETLRRLRLLW